jgi:hypothetical protein
MNKIGSPKNADIKIAFSFYPVFCNIDYTYPTEIDKDSQAAWRLLSFLYYLARYMYIQDQQKDEIYKVFVKVFKTTNVDTLSQLSQEVYQATLDSLSEQEQNAAFGLFKLTPPLYLFDASRDKRPTEEKPVTKYTYQLKYSEAGINTHFDLGLADKLLLPLTVIHLYELTLKNIPKDRADILGQLSINLINDYFIQGDSANWMINAPTDTLNALSSN